MPNQNSDPGGHCDADPTPQPLPTVSTSNYTIEQTIAALELATEEGSILQIDMQDFNDALSLCGSSPVSFNVSGRDVTTVINVCRDAAARMVKHHVAAAVVVCGVTKVIDCYRLKDFKEVFEAFRLAVDESAFLVFGVGFDPSLGDCMSVTCLAGAPDK